MIRLVMRLVTWLWPKPKPLPPRWPLEDDGGEPSEPRLDLSQIKHNENPGVYNPEGITAADLARAYPDLSLAGKKVIAYPDKVDDLSAQDWVTAELARRTGGLTRHPMDLTRYPTPPTESDEAMRDYVNREIETTYGNAPVARGYFTHGYSMRYLGELLARAKRKDPTLTDEELMGLRARGLI